MQVVPRHCQIHLQSYPSLEQGERELSFERDQSITRASSRLRPSIRDLFDSNTFRFVSLPIPSLRDSIVLLPLFHIRIIAFSFLENGRRIHENTVIRSREREQPATLLPGENLRRNLGFNVRIRPREIFMGEEVHVPTISDSFRGASYHVAS